MKKLLLITTIIIVLGAFLITKNARKNNIPNVKENISENKEIKQTISQKELQQEEASKEKKEITQEPKTTSEYVYEERRITLTGVIEKVDRISEDIPYDYIIVTDEKVTGWDSTGRPGGVNMLDIYSEPTSDGRVTQETIEKLKSLEGKRVELTAIIEWGYAEHAQLLIQEIRET